jgi:hypothetical protein
MLGKSLPEVNLYLLLTWPTTWYLQALIDISGKLRVVMAVVFAVVAR